MFTLSIKFKLCLYFGFLLIYTNYVKSYQVETEEDALAYLLNYGYVESKNMPRGFTFQDCDEKLKEFQKMAHIPVTGELDDATIKAMNMPRCGCPDFMKITFREDSDISDNAIIPISDEETDHHHHHHHHSHSSQWPYSRHNRFHHHHHHRRINQTNSRSHIRANRYTISDLKWKSKVVTYNIRKYPSRRDFKVSRREVEDAIHKAFNIWEEHIDLQFVYQSNNVEADIIIQFLSGDHNDGYPFDGPGNALAHAFFPGTGIGGDIHFEEEENWTLGTYNGVDILHVAVHELGHSLGLGHNHNELGSIMFPMYKGYSPNLQLHSDDIQGAQALYGRKSSRNPTPRPTIRTTTTRPTSTRRTTTRKTWTNVTTTTPTPSFPNYELCDGKAVDAILTLFEEAILVFKGENVFEIGRNGEGILPGWPKNIGKYFKGLERDLDCAITRTNGKTYFFKGSKYWRFTGNKMDRGYPRSISEYFPGIPNDLDAAFEWDEEFVFVKGTNFWRFNTRKRPHVERYFPFPISHWGLRKRLDAAFTDWKGDIYFVQGLYYWKFDKVGHNVVHNSHYPGLVTEDWFGCKEP